MKYSVSVCALSLLLFIELPSHLAKTNPVLSLPSKSTLDLPCLPPTAPELSEASITWTFTPESQTQNGSSPILLGPPSYLLPGIYQESIRLSIPTVGMKDEGTYTCVIVGWKDERSVKLRNSFSVRVYDSSAFELLKVAEGEVGEDVQLSCTPPSATLSPPLPGFSNFPVWSVKKQGRWERIYPKVVEEGETNGDGRVRWASPSNLIDDWSVIMSGVTMEDSGVYRCKWAGESQLWSEQVELTVKPTPTEPPPRCRGYNTPWERCGPESSQTSGRAMLQESLSEFSFKLYSHLSQSERSKNMLFSPISISSVLMHLLLGARGNTQVALESALRLPHSFACLHQEMKSLREKLRDSVEVASNIYHSPELQLSQMFINQSQLFYDAVPEKLTNDSDLNARLINEWVAGKTNNMITDLVDSVSSNTILMLLNTVYFNGKWKMMFDKKTTNAPFLTLTGDMISVPVLYSSKYKLAHRYSSHVKAQVAAFPLSGRTTLYILLPHSASLKDLEELEDRLDDQSVRAMVKEMEKTPTETAEVTLPKIHLSIKTNLMEILDTMGLSDLQFDPNLCGLSSEDRNPPLSLSDAQHRAFLSLTEKGVEAGAVSSLSFSRTFPSFAALRPFVLLLWNEQVNGPLFLGRVTEP
ncbi:plasma protease C1 inhibitor [Anguilla rostrata]|uniref:plasma protease C1 inhibitor n=1 Tax=Anguilla rostrata TaxID=7938 RepID=UPI0030D1BEE5